jgi:pimeloyl-ACP methyl ester carboxylesterase
MLKVVEDQVLTASQKLGRKAVAVGHSLGAIPATEIAMDHPEVFSDVVAAAGVHNGKRWATPSTFIVKHIFGNPPHAKLLNHNSGHTNDRRARIATEWSEEVGLHLVITPFDDLLPGTHGLRVDLPEGQEAERKVMALPLPGTNFMLRLLTGHNNTEALESWRLASHYDIVRHPAFINYVRGLQMPSKVIELAKAASEKSSPERSPAQPFMPLPKAVSLVS